MTREQIVDLLARMGLTRDGDVFTTPDGFSVVVYLGVDREPLVVDHVNRIEIAAGFVVVSAVRRDRVEKRDLVEKFGAGIDQVRAVHVLATK